MTKTINTNKSVTRQIVKAILIIILTPVALILLGLLVLFIADPIYDKIDQNKFSTLDSQSRSLYEQMKTTSKGAEDWKYMAVCSDNSQNWMGPAEYNCSTLISTIKIISSTKELTDLHAKYYPIVENSDIWAKHELTKAKSAGDFGDKFFVSYAYNDYKEVKTEIKCSYEINLIQLERVSREISDDLGSAIVGNQGKSYIVIRCDENARDKWYDLVKSKSILNPEI